MIVEYTDAHAAENLLLNCAGLSSADSLLIVHEDPALGWYDAAVTEAVTAAARDLGINFQTIEVGAPQNQRDTRVIEAMQAHDCTLFLSRIGDQDRFAEPQAGKKIVMCYVRTGDMLASGFAGVSYAATQGLKNALDGLISQASRIEIQCPLGTDCSLSQQPSEFTELSDVSVRRFPLGVVTPIDAGGLSGRVALADYLTPTGSSVYEPASLALDETVFVQIESGRIDKFEGAADTVTSVEQHYRQVARQFGIDADFVHSWHVGLHPGLSYLQAAAADPDRWSNTIFNHPRILHFHTCGAYAPGEISWIVKDPSVLLDGKPLWDRGILRVDDFEETRACLQQWPELVRLYAQDAGQIGI